MSTVLPFPVQPRKSHDMGAFPPPPELPWWLEHMSEGDARQYVAARLEVLRALAVHREDTEGPRPCRRSGFRDQVAGAVHSCAVKTDLPLDLVLDDLAAAAELTAEEMASRHMGRTPWRKRILREEKLARKAARRSGALH